jgi:hypothetical protein
MFGRCVPGVQDVRNGVLPDTRAESAQRSEEQQDRARERRPVVATMRADAGKRKLKVVKRKKGARRTNEEISTLLINASEFG